MRVNPVEILNNAFRGALIALAELVPGVSGGTIALVVGVYERAIAAGDDILAACKALFTDRKEAATRFRSLDWALLVPLVGAMAVTILLMAGVMSSFVENQPEISRGLFLGMVAASILVPLRMVDSADARRKRGAAIVAFAIAAVLTFIATGTSSATQSDPALPVYFFAAMFAVCALVLPGVSGSFLLLALGLYQPVLNAVHERDLTVMGVFFLGAVTGIALFIKLLNYLLTQHRTLTLITMSGLLLGSLRALWPWQNDSADLLAAHGNVLAVVGCAILGALIVLGLVWMETFTARKAQSSI
ncbi:hypothetical protein CCICO_05220 [Corynebacterium ciconiae DSM 44920]|uniref:DUF368 domain-containing protein n=1 Tax=Corynebacterium ciconiae TaxID=227319 RepID=UPI00036A9E53|nr:DUF368 domain-containing protein [Corynebacterium ciconiae]WKD61077.1 hypothetical protein CCICO_05220 [Corynebacterium ciconiae DSM 44920]